MIMAHVHKKIKFTGHTPKERQFFGALLMFIQ